ncbi:hypothetical protein [Spiroplasma endosymbiont of Aleiodes alternator]|uniref:hypothetical protein n=1 Tax=Spiroplasma endosymbiont of Aleiodes alternator TaxID=3139329 RepID=UPI003CCABA71
MNTFLKVFLTQRLQFCVYFILDVHFIKFNKRLLLLSTFLDKFIINFIYFFEIPKVNN